ncbi:UDP-N-acetylmuramate dehydrogenase [Paenibacillus flagellatus]|uniref:UDP-N-acetylenolpyruvoylglucosamine reductase n=1 Tax=Paenibacillus flagellatus TaxID=2211139 RepID=A0A2V5K922_9BACL|nr:UDP-N-acetylmuramate dehydrogenase [Paenibacillus flagellatus]PYI54574.1 UDP-N-acetylenolpyruvoylglucosamine reductase [Paenibacillus flagellatus]
MRQLIQDLQAAEVGDVLLDEPLAEYTTWKIGGPADVLVVPSGKAKLAETVRLLHRHGTPFTTIGRGSNMLVSDGGIRGVVLLLSDKGARGSGGKLGRELDKVEFDGDVVTAGAAVSLIPLSVRAGKEGLTGLEFASGIPGTVGGAVYMNAGAHGSDMSRILKEAEIVLETGETVRLSNDEMKFAYRHSLLHERPGIVTEAVLQLKRGDRKEIAAAMASYKDRRLKTQPLQLPCAGSTFRNPDGHHAAKLIEEAGLKGYRVGGAEVSPQHANFIINTGGATAEDVLRLMDHIRGTVSDKFGVSLVPEVLVVGER